MFQQPWRMTTPTLSNYSNVFAGVNHQSTLSRTWPQSTPIASPVRCQADPVASHGSPECRCSAISRAELNRLLLVEEDAYFQSRWQLMSETVASRDFTPSGLMRKCEEEEEEKDEMDAPYFTKGSDDGECKDYLVSKMSMRPSTFMVRHIACKLSAEQIQEHLHELGFKDAYDFFYLPLFKGGRTNMGYFFLNFKDAADAERFKERQQDQPMCDGAKRCDVRVAEFQGLEALRTHFYKKAVMNSGGGPCFL